MGHLSTHPAFVRPGRSPARPRTPAGRRLTGRGAPGTTERQCARVTRGDDDEEGWVGGLEMMDEGETGPLHGVLGRERALLTASR